MARIETLTAYKCKFSYLERNNPLIEEQREAIKAGEKPEYSFSDFIDDYQKYTTNLAIGVNSDRAIILSEDKIYKNTKGNVRTWHLVPYAGKQGKPITVVKRSSGKKYDFGSDSAALYRKIENSNDLYREEQKMSSKVSKHPISQDKRANISARYKRITKSINQTFWNTESETLHSIYVGSYGRGTAIDTSDLDVLFELPSDEYDHFTGLSGNGQSRLLQSVKNAILDTYPRSDVKGDGQVVVVKFSDGMVFEILPAFRNETYLGWDGTYKYPDTDIVNKRYPGTDRRGYRAAQKALQEEDEQTFDDGEAERFLP